MFGINIFEESQQLAKSLFFCLFLTYKCAMFINKKLSIQLRLMGELSLACIVVLDGKSSDQAALDTRC